MRLARASHTAHTWSTRRALSYNIYYVYICIYNMCAAINLMRPAGECVSFAIINNMGAQTNSDLEVLLFCLFCVCFWPGKCLFSRVLSIRFCFEDGGRAIPLNYRAAWLVLSLFLLYLPLCNLIKQRTKLAN